MPIENSELDKLLADCWDMAHSYAAMGLGSKNEAEMYRISVDIRSRIDKFRGIFQTKSCGNPVTYILPFMIPKTVCTCGRELTAVNEKGAWIWQHTDGILACTAKEEKS